MDTFLKIGSTAFSLFLLMDSIGNVPLFVSILKDFSPAAQKKIIQRELLIALAIIILFTFLGNPILALLQVKQHTLLIAGGIILFLISLKMIFPPPEPEENMKPASPTDPLIVPLAVPLTAGPAVLASVVVYAHQESHFITVAAVILAWLASFCVLLSANFLKKVLRDQGLLACAKLMGLILILIAVQMCLQGITLYTNYDIKAIHP